MDLTDVRLHCVNILVQFVDSNHNKYIQSKCTGSLPTNIEFQCPKNNVVAKTKTKTKTNTGIYNNLVNKDT